MEIKVNAIVLKSVDYKENDKILTLYSLECGKIVAGIKGVKRFGAKLKFAQEPFCFAEFILSEKGGKYTVIGATFLDNFYNLRLDLEKYYTSAIIGEILLSLVEDGFADEKLFSTSINAIKNICYQKNERLTLSLYLKEVIEILGYDLQVPTCINCGCKIRDRVFFDFRNASFYCYDCKIENLREIKIETCDAFFKLCNDQEKAVLSKDEQDKLLKFLIYYLEYKTESKLKSGEALMKIG